MLNMDADDLNETESEYRIRFGDDVKYILVHPGTFDRNTTVIPNALVSSLPRFPLGKWTSAEVFKQDEKISYTLWDDPLPGVEHVWHPNVVDILTLSTVKRIGARVQLVQYGSQIVIAKFAPFAHDVEAIARETEIYHRIDGRGVGPTFLGHLAESGRVMGFLLEHKEGRFAGIEDLDACQSALQRLHFTGIIHGDNNRYNFLVSEGGVTLVDFEHARVGSIEEMEQEMNDLPAMLKDESGIGCKNWRDEDEDED